MFPILEACHYSLFGVLHDGVRTTQSSKVDYIGLLCIMMLMSQLEHVSNAKGKVVSQEGIK